MTEILSALLPVFLLIMLGAVLKRTSFVSDAFWMPAEKLTYYLFFPSLLATTLSRAQMDMAVFPMVGALALAMVAMTLFLLLVRRGLQRWKAIEGPAFTSLFQGSVRFNTYVGLAAASGLYGEAGVALMAVSLAVWVPSVNVFCVTILAWYGKREEGAGVPGPVQILKQLFRNPLIAGCAVGIAANLSGVGLPGVPGDLLEIAGRAALPLGLLAVGAGLDIRKIREAGFTVWLSSVLRLVCMPVIVLAGGIWLELSPLHLQVAILFASLPTATSAFILARQMGGDYSLMAAIITGQTILAVLSMPACLLVARML